MIIVPAKNKNKKTIENKHGGLYCHDLHRPTNMQSYVWFANGHVLWRSAIKHSVFVWWTQTMFMLNQNETVLNVFGLYIFILCRFAHGF